MSVARLLAQSGAPRHLDFNLLCVCVSSNKARPKKKGADRKREQGQPFVLSQSPFPHLAWTSVRVLVAILLKVWFGPVLCPSRRFFWCAMWGLLPGVGRPRASYQPPRPPLPVPRGMRIGQWSGGPALQWLLPAASPTLPSPAVVRAWVGEDEPHAKRARSEAVAPPPGAGQGSVATTVALNAASSATRLGEEARARKRAIDEWGEVVRELGVCSRLGLRMKADGESFDASSPSLSASLSAKSTATLLKRLSAIRLYRRWRVACGLPGLDFAEPDLFRYFQFSAR